MSRTIRYAATICAVLLLSGAAFADGKGDVKDARDKVKEDKKELREARQAHDAGAAKEAKDALKADREKLREERKERRKKHLDEMKAKYGPGLKVPAVRAEMRVHAARMARLHRVEHLAKVAKKDAVVKRTEAAIEKEKARHQKRMDELKSAPGGAASGAPSAAPATSGGAK